MARDSVQESGLLISIPVTVLAILCSQLTYLKNDHKKPVQRYIKLISSKYVYKVSLN